MVSLKFSIFRASTRLEAELLTELLSSMTEDLNLVKNKKFVEAEDNDYKKCV